MGVGVRVWRGEYLRKYIFSIFRTLSICKINIKKTYLTGITTWTMADVTFLLPLLLKEIDIIEEGIPIFKIWIYIWLSRIFKSFNLIQSFYGVLYHHINISHLYPSYGQIVFKQILNKYLRINYYQLSRKKSW